MPARDEVSGNPPDPIAGTNAGTSQGVCGGGRVAYSVVVDSLPVDKYVHIGYCLGICISENMYIDATDHLSTLVVDSLIRLRHNNCHDLPGVYGTY